MERILSFSRLAGAAAITLAGLVAAGVLRADETDPEVNYVGFQTIVVPANGIAMIATPFTPATQTIDAVVGSQLTGGKSSSSSDQVMLWDQTNQCYRTYWKGRTGADWYDLAGNLATDVCIHPDTGFGVRNRRTNDVLLFLHGAVVNDEIVTNLMPPGLTMVSYPFSADVDINHCDLTNGLGGKGSGLADAIYKWNATNCCYETWWISKFDGQFHELNGAPSVGVRVGGGQGFWYRNRAASNRIWIERRPYPLP